MAKPKMLIFTKLLLNRLSLKFMNNIEKLHNKTIILTKVKSDISQIDLQFNNINNYFDTRC